MTIAAMSATSVAAAAAGAAATVNEAGLCRMSKFSPMPRPAFKYFSCTQCYRYLSSVFTNFESRLFMSDDGAYYYMYNETMPVHFDPTSSVQIEMLKRNMGSLEFTKWRECCDAAMRCCDDVMAPDISIQGIFPFSP